MAGGEPGPLSSPSWEEMGMIEDGAVAAAGGNIVAIGTTADVERCVEVLAGSVVLDGRGKLLMPGFIDPHTHFLFAGTREDEYALRVEGVDYLEIRRRGGGIRKTVRQFREADDEVLIRWGTERLNNMLAAGTTTVEGKSGYGLTVEQETRALRLMGTIDANHPIDVERTFLGAHEIPAEYEGRRGEYLDLVVEEMIPKVEGLARFCDVFCEKGVFSVEESRRVLLAGVKHGMLPKLHAEEFASIGGGELAAEVNAVSADHLLAVTEAGCAAMAEKGVMAIVLPGTAIGLAGPHFVDIEMFRRNRLPVALGTDCNPGSSFTESMAAVISLSCSLERFTVPEALMAATRNAAAAIRLLDRIGTLEEGKRADMILVDAVHPAAIPYRFASNIIGKVIKSGEIVHSSDQGFSFPGRN